MFHTTQEIIEDIMKFELLKDSCIGLNLEDNLDGEDNEHHWVILYSEMYKQPLNYDFKKAYPEQINELMKRVDAYIAEARTPKVDRSPSNDFLYTVYEEYNHKPGWFYRMETNIANDVEHYLKTYKTWKYMIIYDRDECNIKRYNQLQGPIESLMQ